MFLFLYFFVVVALPVALGIYVVFHGLERSRRCPACADETLPLRSRLRSVASRLVRHEQLQLRWCIGCGWRGTVRLRALPPASFSALPVAGPGTGFASLTTDRVDIRRLNLDGDAWTVMVQCWAEEDHWVGRLFFIANDGRECVENGPSLRGRSAVEVLSRALAMPDQALLGRLRRAAH